MQNIMENCIAATRTHDFYKKNLENLFISLYHAASRSQVCLCAMAFERNSPLVSLELALCAFHSEGALQCHCFRRLFGRLRWHANCCSLAQTVYQRAEPTNQQESREKGETNIATISILSIVGRGTTEAIVCTVRRAAFTDPQLS